MSELVGSIVTGNNEYLEELLGQGAQGFGAYKISRGGGVAKIIQDSSSFEFDPEKIITEINILKNVNHPNIVNVTDNLAFKLNDKVYYGVVMEPLSVPLDKIIYSYNELNYAQVKRITFQLLSAVEYIGENKILHADIKPSNVMFDDRGNIKLIDFGSSIFIINEGQIYYSLGTSFYQPPEFLLRGEIKTNHIDCWSTIMTILECFKKTPVIFPSKFYKDGSILKIDGEAISVDDYDPEYISIVREIAKLYKEDELKIDFDITGIEGDVKTESGEIEEGILSKSLRSLDPFDNNKSFVEKLLGGVVYNKIKTQAEKYGDEEFSNFQEFVVHALKFNIQGRPLADDLLNHKYMLGVFENIKGSPMTIPSKVIESEINGIDKIVSKSKNGDKFPSLIAKKIGTTIIDKGKVEDIPAPVVAQGDDQQSGGGFLNVVGGAVGGAAKGVVNGINNVRSIWSG